MKRPERNEREGGYSHIAIFTVLVKDNYQNYITMLFNYNELLLV
jgi:hypothetical protein